MSNVLYVFHFFTTSLSLKPGEMGKGKKEEPSIGRLTLSVKKLLTEVGVVSSSVLTCDTMEVFE